MLTVADRGEGGKICQNLADVICERSQRHFFWNDSNLFTMVILPGRHTGEQWLNWLLTMGRLRTIHKMTSTL